MIDSRVCLKMVYTTYTQHLWSAMAILINMELMITCDNMINHQIWGYLVFGQTHVIRLGDRANNNGNIYLALWGWYMSNNGDTTDIVWSNGDDKWQSVHKQLNTDSSSYTLLHSQQQQKKGSQQLSATHFDKSRAAVRSTLCFETVEAVDVTEKPHSGWTDDQTSNFADCLGKSRPPGSGWTYHQTSSSDCLVKSVSGWSDPGNPNDNRELWRAQLSSHVAWTILGTLGINPGIISKFWASGRHQAVVAGCFRVLCGCQDSFEVRS